MPTRPPLGTLPASQSGMSGHPGVPPRISVHAGPSCWDACRHIHP